jgi:hypothetical protein
MTSNPRRLILVAGLLSCVPLLGAPARMEQAPAPQATRAIQLPDIIEWNTIGVTALSNDGQWFAYRLAPQEGDGRVIVRRTRGEKEHRFDVGETPQAGGGGRGGPDIGGAPSTLGFSDDSKWVAFTTHPSRAEQQRLRRQRRPINSSVSLVNLETGEKRDYGRIRRFAFAGELSTWIALHRQPPQPAGGAPGGRGEAPAAPAAGGAGGPAAPERARGTDLILRELATGQEVNVGNVSEFAFTRDGKLLATVIDAQDRVGNGIQLRDLTKGTVTALDHGDAVYERLTWTEKGDGLAALKGTDDKALRDKRYAVVAFTGFGAEVKKTIYDPSKDKTFPSGMTISGNRSPQWTDSLDAIVFGIHEPRRRDSSAPGTPATCSGTGRTPGSSLSSRSRRTRTARSATSRSTACSRRSSSAWPTTRCAASR